MAKYASPLCPTENVSAAHQSACEKYEQELSKFKKDHDVELHDLKAKLSKDKSVAHYVISGWWRHIYI